MQQHGDTVAGRKIELIIRDDGGVADNAHRLDPGNDRQRQGRYRRHRHHADARSPSRRLSTEAKKVTLVMSSGASITTTKSSVFRARRLSCSSQQSWILAEWAVKNGCKPRRHAGQRLGARHRGGDRVQDPLHPGRRRRSSNPSALPLANPDFAPFLQRIADLKPDTAFIYFPGTAGADLRQAVRRAGPWPSPASKSSGRAISPTTTVSTIWAIRCSA